MKRSTFIEDMGSNRCLACGRDGDDHVAWNSELLCVPPVTESQATIEAIANAVVAKLLEAKPWKER